MGPWDGASGGLDGTGEVEGGLSGKTRNGEARARLDKLIGLEPLWVWKR